MVMTAPDLVVRRVSPNARRILRKDERASIDTFVGRPVTDLMKNKPLNETLAAAEARAEKNNSIEKRAVKFYLTGFKIDIFLFVVRPKYDTVTYSRKQPLTFCRDSRYPAPKSPAILVICPRINIDAK